MELMEIIKTRRSIRRYQSKSVADRTVDTILEAARWAPSWANSQCWRFIVVRDRRIKTALSETLGTPNRAAGAIASAPVVIVVCAEIGKAGYRSAKPNVPATDKGDYWYMFDVALAMQNMVLVAHSLGLGTVYVGAFDAQKAAGILEVPLGFCVVAMTPLGYPDDQPMPTPRNELSNISFREKFGSW